MAKLLSASLALALVLTALPSAPHAQMRVFEQSMMRLKTRLPPATFDGTTLNVTTWPQLVNATNFLKKFGLNLSKAVGAWKALGRGQNQTRLANLKAHQDYWKALKAAHTAKAAEIKPPEKPKPVEIKVVKLSEVYIGPDAGSDKPYIVDTIGREETLFRAWGSPGSRSKKSRWTAKLWFWVKYADIATDDVVLIQLRKGRKKLGKPTPCRPSKVMKELELAHFECWAPAKRDYKSQFKTTGAHTIELSYKKPIEGKLFKKFAVLKVKVKTLKKGASNNPTPAWGTDHDMKMSVSTIEEKTQNSGRGQHGHAANAFAAAFRKGIPYVMVHTWLKAEKGHLSTKLVCLYKGKRVAEANNVGGKNFSSWSYVRKRSPKRDDHKWSQVGYMLHLMKPRPGSGGQRGSYSRPVHWLHENPGEYKCVVTGGGDILKELYFTVGADGEIVKPACQLKSMNTLSTLTLLTAKDIKVSTRSYDKKIGKKFGFEGRIKWARGCPPTKR